MAIAVLPEQVCRFRCLGPIVLTDAAGGTRPFRTRKQIALLVFLARRPGRPIARDELIDLLWSTDAEKAARHSLSQTVSLINKSMGLEAIETAGRDRLVLRGDAVWLDVNEFERLATSGEHEAAMKLWRGTLLESVWVQRAPNFEHWLSEERGRLQRVFRRMAHSRLESLRVAGDYGAMRDESERLLQYDALDEKAMLAYLEALTLLGDRSLALQRYAEFEKRLTQELAAEPSTGLRTWAKRNRRSDTEMLADRLDHGPSRVSEVVVLPPPVPLFGRHDEFSALWKAWEDVRRGVGSFFSVEGEAGIGKTALMTKLVNQAHVGGGSVCYVTCYKTEKAVPFAPITALVRQLARLPGFVAMDPVWIGELTRLVPELRDRHPNAPPPMAPDDAVRLRLSDAAVRAVLSVADEQPLLIAIDDLQDADEPTLALLHYLCRQPQQPALIVAARRTGYDPADYERTFFSSLMMARACRVLTLGSLSPTDVERLAHQVIATRGVSAAADLMVRVTQIAGGNPLHVIEAALAAATDRIESLYPRNSDSSVTTFADQFHDAVLKRLSALPESSRSLAGALAVAGHPLFEYELAEITGLRPANLGVALLALENSQFAMRSGSRVRLVHDRYSVVIDTALSDMEKITNHAKLARLIERSAAANPAAHYQAARHYEAARNFRKAAGSAASAVNYAAQIGAVRSKADALRLLLRVSTEGKTDIGLSLALCLAETNQFGELDSLCAELRSQPLPDEIAAELLFIEMLAASESGRASMHELRHGLERLLAESGRFAHRREAEGLLVRVADKVGEYALARRTARHLRKTQAGGPLDRHSVFAAGYTMSKYRDPRRAIPLLERSIAMAQESNDWTLESLARDGLGIALKQIGRFRDSIDQFNTSLALARKTLNPNTEARCLQNRVVSEMALGFKNEVLATFDEADALAHESWAYRVFNLYNRGMVRLFDGEHSLAIERLEMGCEMAARHGMEYMRADCLACISLAALRMGDMALFKSKAEAAAKIDDPNKAPRFSWVIQAASAWHLALVKGEPQAAIDAFDRYLKSMRRFDVAHWLSMSLERVLLLESINGVHAEMERSQLKQVAMSFEARTIARLCGTR